ncbi:unnamed protein product [marine sediment metagenome]|uniref:Uncharacterized protein n=1 Tax=marine sediment metagenome TaxID=412755 RepID=X0WZ26_9ZZZZ
MGIMKPIAGFVGLMILTPLAGAAMSAVGGIGAMSSGMVSTTQSMIGVGLVGHAASISKGMFKW